jgi:hypothetical protein
MELIRELLQLAESSKEKLPPVKKAAAKVYHRDYVKTRKKIYRKYDPKQHGE